MLQEVHCCVLNILQFQLILHSVQKRKVYYVHHILQCTLYLVLSTISCTKHMMSRWYTILSKVHILKCVLKGTLY